MIVVGIHQTVSADGDLVCQIADGRLDSLGVLFDRYHADVRRLLARLQVPPGDLDDLVQTTFLEIPRAAARFDASRPVRAWLLGLAAVVAKRHRRSIGRVARKLAAFAVEPWHTHQQTPADMVIHDEATKRAARALERLSPKKRDAFVLVVLEHLSGEAAAEALGIPVATIWTRLHHARRDLRALLAQEGERS